MNNAQATWVIYVTFLVGLILMLIPLPMEWRVIRPDALTLALFYWVVALPHRVGIFTAFCVGLLVGVFGRLVGWLYIYLCV